MKNFLYQQPVFQQRKETQFLYSFLLTISNQNQRKLVARSNDNTGKMVAIVTVTKTVALEGTP